SLTAGAMYTVAITLNKSGGGNTIVHTSPNATAGKVFFNKGASKAKFYSDSDMKFEIGTTGSNIVVQSVSYGTSTRKVPQTDKLKSILQDMANSGNTSFNVNNQLILYDHGLKDPAPGKQKTLTVTYLKAGKSYTNAKVEKQKFSF
ncbi:MAG: hypothetical protein AAF696_37090, partial [Bacteroidota bacterium]